MENVRLSIIPNRCVVSLSMHNVEQAKELAKKALNATEVVILESSRKMDGTQAEYFISAEQYEIDLAKTKAAFRNKEMKLLTPEAAQMLIGKKIRTLYFGHGGQDGIDTFVLGYVGFYKGDNRTAIVTADDRNTCIFLEKGAEAFHCTDTDRDVYYMEV